MFVQDSDEMLLASLSGQLAIRGECLVVVSGDTSYAVAWHASSAKWNAEQQAIEFDGARVHVGDDLALGGGEMPVRSDNLDNWEWAIAPNAGCLQQDHFWFAWALDRELTPDPTES